MRKSYFEQFNVSLNSFFNHFKYLFNQSYFIFQPPSDDGGINCLRTVRGFTGIIVVDLFFVNIRCTNVGVLSIQTYRKTFCEQFNRSLICFELFQIRV